MSTAKVNCLVLVTAIVSFTVGTSQPLCADVNPTGCQLFAQSLPNLCSDPTLSSTCQKFCGLCPVECYQCPTPTRDPLSCNTTQICSKDQTCLLSQLMSKDGHQEWTMQCVGKQVCEGVGYGFGASIIGKRDSDHDISERDVTFKCCRTDNCNMPVIPTTTPPPTTPITFPTLSPGQELDCAKDVAITLDSSGSIGHVNFQHVLDFVSKLIELIHIGPSDAQIALETFSAHAVNEWYLDEYSNKTDMIVAVQNVTYNAGATHTGEALTHIIQNVFTPAHGDRPSIPNAVIVITDGQSNNKQQTINAAKKLHAVSSDVIAIGVSKAVNDIELRAIASDGQRTVRVHGFGQLLGTLNRVVHLLCA